MAERTRTMSTVFSHTGTVYNEKNNYLDSASTSIGMDKSCVDTIGNREGFNNLSLSEVHRYGGLVNGIRRHSNGGVFRTFYDYPIAALQHAVPDPTAASGYPIGPIELNEYALQLLAETNPGRSEVNVPQFLSELKDLPSLVRGYGRSVLKNLAVAHLQYRWGWRPLVTDIRNLLNFKEKTDRRFKELDRLRKGLKLKKGRTLDSGQKVRIGSNFTAQSAHFSVTGKWIDRYTHRVWGTVQWYCPNWNNPFKDLNDKELTLKTRQILAGVNSAGALAAAWEIIPWSWLVGWFSNVDDVVNATANSTEMRHRGICIMQHSTLSRTLEHSPLPYGLYELEMEPILRRHERKKRYAVPYVLAFPTFRLPILTSRKLSIIAALSALRFPESDRVAFKRQGLF